MTKEKSKAPEVEPPWTRTRPYNYLWGLTGSIRVKHDNIRINTNSGITVGESRYLNKKSSFQLMNIVEYASKLGEKPLFDTEEPELPEGYLKYRLPYSKVDILDYGDLPDLEKEWNSANYAKRNVLLSQRWSKERLVSLRGILFNEWAVVDKDVQDTVGDWKKAWQVAYDLLLLLGCRRSWVFVRELAVNMFHISLPVGKMGSRKAIDEEGENRNRYQSEVGNFLVVPILTLNLNAANHALRRTASVSLLLVPANPTFNGPRTASIHEMRHIYSDTEFHICGSPLSRFLKPYQPSRHAPSLTVNKWLELICGATYDMITGESSSEGERETERREASNQLAISKHATLAILHRSLDNSGIEGFYRNPSSSQMRDELKYIVTPDRYLTDVQGLPNPDVVKLRKMVVEDKARIDSAILEFFDKSSSRLISLSQNRREAFPEHSVKWQFAWNLLMSISMSALDTMIHSFYHELEHRNNAMRLAKVETDLVDDIEEFYDLGISRPLFKEEYECMRAIDGVDDDFHMLKDKLAALKQNAVIEEQQQVEKSSLAVIEKLHQVEKRILLYTVLLLAVAVATIVISFLLRH